MPSVRHILSVQNMLVSSLREFSLSFKKRFFFFRMQVDQFKEQALCSKQDFCFLKAKITSHLPFSQSLTYFDYIFPDF